uniref:Eukaryotic translation initiation factor 3 subunit B-like n=1 Tax=Tanacetum cinerariifolium TaxID=118510 RepID=A0A6L2M423_TANCI|nr:eukaryotic translation initiation factor 3 subunit B-like [Tanacetum cinerariifolium]
MSLQEGKSCILSGAVSLGNPSSLVIPYSNFHKGHAPLFEEVDGDYNIPESSNNKFIDTGYRTFTTEAGKQLQECKLIVIYIARKDQDKSDDDVKQTSDLSFSISVKCYNMSRKSTFKSIQDKRMVGPLLLKTCFTKEDWEDENDFLVRLCKLSTKLLRDDASVKIEEDSLPKKDDMAVPNDKSSVSKCVGVVLNIFNVINRKVMRDFKGSANEFAIGRSGSSPVFRWGGGIEDKYFARMGTNVISNYKTETFSLIDKKDIKVENVMDLCWSLTDPIFALYIPELNGENQPARVYLFQIPCKKELRQKNLFSVSDCKMDWQSNGKYLAVKVDDTQKPRKALIMALSFSE